nr:ribonuclease H-like domain-containing protein [Tanacetum cinerariifolium]
MNKLVRHNLVRGLPTKCFENDHTCTACMKGKQHKASCTKDATSQEVESSSSKPQDHCSTKVPEGSGNPNPTASTSNPPADPMEILW